MPNPEKRDESWIRALAKSRVERLQSGGGAMQASTIGFVLAGSIAAGFFLGSWLDARLKTGFWMPLLTVLGVFGGFFQMLQILKQIDEAARREDAQAKRNRVAKAPDSKAQNAERRSRAAVPSEAQSATEAEEERTRPRIFAVPPPPTASFERDGGNETTNLEAQPLRDDEDERTLTERLLQDDSAKPQ